MPLRGRPIVLTTSRGSQQERVTVIAQKPRLTWSFSLSTFAALWLLLFATLLAVRGANMPQTRLLSLWIATFVLTGALLGFAAPSAWTYVLLGYLREQLHAPLSVALLAAFASGFAQPLSRLRRLVQWLCYAFLASFTAISFVGITGLITLRFDRFPSSRGTWA